MIVLLFSEAFLSAFPLLLKSFKDTWFNANELCECIQVRSPLVIERPLGKLQECAVFTACRTHRVQASCSHEAFTEELSSVSVTLKCGESKQGERKLIDIDDICFCVLFIPELYVLSSCYKIFAHSVECIVVR